MRAPKTSTGLTAMLDHDPCVGYRDRVAIYKLREYKIPKASFQKPSKLLPLTNRSQPIKLNLKLVQGFHFSLQFNALLFLIKIFKELSL